MKRSIQKEIVDGLREFRDAAKSGEPIGERMTVRSVRTRLTPHRYTGSEVRSTRELLAASQTVFAEFLGVSPKTVRAWEQEVNTPSPIAARFLDEIRHNPSYMRNRLREALEASAS